jgi:hypothetical protein
MNRSCLLVSIALTAAASGPSAAQSAAANPCAAAEHHQFDFWIGDWDVTTPDGKVAGHNHVESIANGCGIEENWTGAGGGTGRSLNTYVAADRQWHQFWVGAGGSVLQLSGSFAGNVMTFRDATNRLSFTRNDDATVRQVWQTTRDGGKTWQTAFDGKYVRAQPRTRGR